MKMCDPIQVFGAIMSHGEKERQTQEQNKRAREDYFQKVKQTQLAKLQTHASMTDQLFQDTLVAKQNQAMAYAGAENFGGSLVGRLVRNQHATEARNKHNIEQNYSMDVQQKQYEMQGYQTQSHGRMREGPSLIPVGLELYDIYNKHDAANKGVKK